MLTEHSHTFVLSVCGYLSRGGALTESGVVDSSGDSLQRYETVATKRRQESDVVRIDVLPDSYLAQITEVQQCVAPLWGFASESEALWEVRASIS